LNLILFDPKGKELKNSGFLGEIFRTQTKGGLPDPSNKKLTQPGSKFFDLNPSLPCV